MKARRTRDLPAPLGKAHQRFERWRTKRPRGSLIPEALWASAAKLAAEYGVHRTARALRLNGQALKKRIQSIDPGEGPKTEPVSSFWELAPGSVASARECIVEMEDGRGARMRIEWKGGEVVDVAAVSRLFWSERS